MMVDVHWSNVKDYLLLIRSIYYYLYFRFFYSLFNSLVDFVLLVSDETKHVVLPKKASNSPVPLTLCSRPSPSRPGPSLQSTSHHLTPRVVKGVRPAKTHQYRGPAQPEPIPKADWAFINLLPTSSITYYTLFLYFLLYSSFILFNTIY